MISRQHRSTSRSGVTLVEVAIVLPLCLLFIFGIYEYCRYIMVQQLLVNAAREGARYAVVNTQGKTTADVQNMVDQRLAGQSIQLQNYNKTTDIQVYMADPTTGNPIDTSGNVVAWTSAPFTNAGFGQTIAVRITGTYKPVLPFLGNFNRSTLTIMPSAVPVQVTCMMNSEAN